MYAEPFDLPTMKLLILHVSEHRDENLVRPIWNQIFKDGESSVAFTSLHSHMRIALEPDADAQINADRIISKIVPLGQRFYPSESAFPLRECLRSDFVLPKIQCYSSFRRRAHRHVDHTVCPEP
jgi:nuclear pore complex protein Nup155